MNVDKITLTLTKAEHQTLLDIFEYYIKSSSVATGYAARVIGEFDCSNEYNFILEYLQSFSGKFKWGLILNEWEKSRIDKIDWLFGSDNGGEPEFKMPANYDEMKEFLIDYDMDYIGD